VQWSIHVFDLQPVEDGENATSGMEVIVYCKIC
jgi:hypothetical protein